MADAITPNDRIDTIKVKNPNTKDGFMIINRHEFDDDQKSKKPKYEEFEEDDTDADGDGIPDRLQAGRNTSGTFDEPTPTDVRYTNKDATEFENNHGSHLGNSAAELREASGMPQKPGGLLPEVRKSVKNAEAALQAAAQPTRGVIKRKAFLEMPKETEAKEEAKATKKAKANKKKGKGKKKPRTSTADKALDDQDKDESEG